MKAHRKSDFALAARPSNSSAPRVRCVRVLCVDDHALLVEGMRARFEIDGRISVVGFLESARGLLEEVKRTTPDLVLLDVDLPGPDIFETVDRMRHEYPELPFAFLTAYMRDGYLTAAYKCGASGFFTKSESISDIIEAIEQIAHAGKSEFVLTPKVKAHYIPVSTVRARPCASAPKSSTECPVATPLQSLTARELEILRLIGKGFSRIQIAEQIARSPKTVDGHQERIMKKLAVDSRSDLLRFAIREGLAEA